MHVFISFFFLFKTMEKRFEEELKRRDMKIILEMDQKLMDQQNMLEKAGVPGFFLTNNRQDVRLQMYLLEFINRLGSKENTTWWTNNTDWNIEVTLISMKRKKRWKIVGSDGYLFPSCLELELSCLCPNKGSFQYFWLYYF